MNALPDGIPLVQCLDALSRVHCTSLVREQMHNCLEGGIKLLHTGNRSVLLHVSFICALAPSLHLLHPCSGNLESEIFLGNGRNDESSCLFIVTKECNPPLTHAHVAFGRLFCHILTAFLYDVPTRAEDLWDNLAGSPLVFAYDALSEHNSSRFHLLFFCNTDVF